jgi:hypothetical protein
MELSQSRGNPPAAGAHRKITSFKNCLGQFLNEVIFLKQIGIA